MLRNILAVCFLGLSRLVAQDAAQAPLPNDVLEVLVAAMKQSPVVVVGVVDRDSGILAAKTPMDRLLVSVRGAFSMARVTVETVLRASGKISETIYVEEPPIQMRSGRWRPADMGSDGEPRLLFLVPNEKLRDTRKMYPPAFREESRMIDEALKVEKPLEVFQKLGLAGVLHEGSWFSVYDGRPGGGAFRVNRPNFSKIIPVTPSPSGQFNHYRAMEANFLHRRDGLDPKFLDDLKNLLVQDFVEVTSAEQPASTFRAKLKTSSGRQLFDRLLRREDK